MSDPGYETDETVIDSSPENSPDSPSRKKSRFSQLYATPEHNSPKRKSGATLSTYLTDKTGNKMYTKDGKVVTTRNNIGPYYNGPLSDRNREIIPQTKLWGGKKTRSRKTKKTKKTRSRKMKK
jgi:hypothetical protein